MTESQGFVMLGVLFLILQCLIQMQIEQTKRTVGVEIGMRVESFCSMLAAAYCFVLAAGWWSW